VAQKEGVVVFKYRPRHAQIQIYEIKLREDTCAKFAETQAEVGNQLPGYVTPKTKTLFEEYRFLRFEAVQCCSS
jgi:hypothetical protein